MDMQYCEPTLRNNGDWLGCKTDIKTTYAPEKGEGYVESHLTRMYVGNAPTLRQVRDDHGDNAINAWLTEQLQYMFDLSDIKIDQVKLNSLIRLIRAKYHWLKLTEFMHFVFLFRTGEFGKVYGKADGQTVMLALKDYCKVREDILTAIAEDSRQQEIEEFLSAPRAQATSAAQRIAEYMASPEYLKCGEWRKEPWSPILSRWYHCTKLPEIRGRRLNPRDTIAEEERNFPGNWTYEQRKAFAEKLGYHE